MAMKSGGKVQLPSRNDNDFNVRYSGIVKALAPMPDETIIDGEVVALDRDGKPSFSTLQNYGPAGAPLHFYIFDLEAKLEDLIRSVKAQGLEGLVAKRPNSKYELGIRSGAWQKMRVNRGQEFVIGGYTPSSKNFDALVIGYYERSKLTYAARARNGFTPASRAELSKKLKPLEIFECPSRTCRRSRLGGGEPV